MNENEEARALIAEQLNNIAERILKSERDREAALRRAHRRAAEIDKLSTTKAGLEQALEALGGPLPVEAELDETEAELDETEEEPF